MSMINWVSERKRRLIENSRSKIREKAILKAKARIALAGKKVADFDQDELEYIVRDEEDKIIDTLKTSSLYGVLALLGLGYL